MTPALNGHPETTGGPFRTLRRNPRSSLTSVGASQPGKPDRPSHAVRVLQVCVIAAVALPSNGVIKAIGYASPGALVAMAAFGVYVAAILFGQHNPLDRRHPVRAGIEGLWVVSLASFAAVSLTEISTTQLLAAERWFQQLATITGVALIAAECLPTLQDIKRVLRALLWAGAFGGLIAALQFWLTLDLTPYLLRIPGFTLTADPSGISTRGALHRVAGVSLSPIELGVVTGMILPLGIWLALYDRQGKPWRRWLPVGLTAMGVVATVSRSTMISVGIAMVFFVATLPATKRVIALAISPLAVLAIFTTVPGFISTLTHYFTAGAADTSISHRTNNFTYVAETVRQAPLLGHGVGAFIFVEHTYQGMLHVLDDQFLTTSMELGLVGVAVLVYYLGLPVATALAARQRTKDPELRSLCGAVAGAAMAGLVCSATFDSLSFPMFSCMFALVAGLAGAGWLLVNPADRRREPFTERTSQARLSSAKLSSGGDPSSPTLPGG